MRNVYVVRCQGTLVRLNLCLTITKLLPATHHTDVMTCDRLRANLKNKESI